MHESEKWKWSRSVVSDSSDPMDCSLPSSSVHGIFQAKVLEWGAIAFSIRIHTHSQLYKIHAKHFKYQIVMDHKAQVIYEGWKWTNDINSFLYASGKLSYMRRKWIRILYKLLKYPGENFTWSWVTGTDNYYWVWFTSIPMFLIFISCQKNYTLQVWEHYTSNV